MKKQKTKTHKASVKRFKITSSGKVIHNVQGNNHLKANKSKSQKARKSGEKSLQSKNQKIKIFNLINS